MQKEDIKITKAQAISIIGSGRFFSCEFTKRTTGEKRKMLARVGVKKHLKGGNAPYSFKDHGLIPVYDLQKREYRCIPIDNITQVNHLPVSND